MRRSLIVASVSLLLGMAATSGLAQPTGAPATQPAGAAAQGGAPGESPAADSGLGKGLGVLGLCLGASLTVLGGALGIGNIGARATESIARQPEAAGSMFLAWLLPAAMIEGAMLFGVLVCYMAIGLLR
jgi:F-type H+-transporting ATPase subunit c